ncbi:MAG: YggS family pyridoxal phosphate-dependent enzyme [Candidatus Sericytochromatia bacterium]|nr:YggS family pyridoxal phosphate-dependent enzyme [Candidatus Tanganyikabacteria bacterium]
MSELPVAEAIRSVRARIAEAARRAGRDPAGVGLVAVTKGVTADRVRVAAAAGISCIGENRVQEALGKAAALADLDLEWHMVGHLQRNKVAAALGLFDVIQSVDSTALLEEISGRARALGRRQRVLLQVNVARDPRKHGFEPDRLAAAVEIAGDLPGVQVEGLMTIPAQDADPDKTRATFRALRELRDRVAPGLAELSMGMTGDFEVAVEEGATLVRVGTGIFGSRN